MTATGDETTMTPLELMGYRNSKMHSEESISRGREFIAKPTDIFITTYPKCGTTWVTQIAHSLRTRGSMDFGEITEVVPWDICALDCDQNLNDDQVAEPRLFKSHETYENIGKGGKYIYVARNPLDAFVSFYHFLPAYMGLEPGALSMDEFANAIFAGVSVSGGIWGHYLSWWERRNDDNVLWLFYEDLKDDLNGSIELIATFMDIPLDDELREIVLDRASFAFMSEHGAQFDDHFLRNKVKDRMGLSDSPVSAVGKVRKDGGTVGGRKAIPDNVVALLDERWKGRIEENSGLKDYTELRAALSKLSPKCTD